MDPEFLDALHAIGLQRRKVATNIHDYRENTHDIMRWLLDYPVPSSVTETVHTIKASDGAKIIIYQFKPKKTPSPGGDAASAAAGAAAAVTTPPVEADDEQAGEHGEAPGPAVLYFHGGGIVSCPIDTVTKPMVGLFAADNNVETFAVEYRLAPEHPYPTPLEDCYDALKWLVANAGRFNIDPARIGLAGESGGACLAAGLCLRTRDEEFLPPIAAQMLIYPMLDHTTASRVHPDDIWRAPTAPNSRIGWAAYLHGSYEGEEGMTGQLTASDVSEYAVPLSAKNLKGLPRAYIDVGGLDMVCNEAVQYGAKLLADGVDTETHVYSGALHVFDLIAPKVSLTLNAKDNRRRFIGKI
jgi:acetyl esterase/lipase